MKQRIGAFAYLLVAVCLLVGCTAYPKGQSLTCADLQLTLPGDFINLSAEAYAQDADFLYGRNTLIFKGMAEKKADFKDMTLEDYTALVLSGNELSCTPKPFGNGYIFTYEALVSGMNYTYTTATFAGETNFWILQFYCPSEDCQENQAEIDIILSNVQLKNR